MKHGIREAFYSVKPFGVYPWIECLCGWETNGNYIDDSLF